MALHQPRNVGPSKVKVRQERATHKAKVSKLASNVKKRKTKRHKIKIKTVTDDDSVSEKTKMDHVKGKLNTTLKQNLILKPVDKNIGQGIESVAVPPNEHCSTKRHLKRKHSNRSGHFDNKRPCPIGTIDLQKDSETPVKTSGNLNSCTTNQIKHHKRNCMKHKRRDKNKKLEDQKPTENRIQEKNDVSGTNHAAGTTDKSTNVYSSNYRALHEDIDHVDVTVHRKKRKPKKSKKFVGERGQLKARIKKQRPQIWFDDVDETLLEPPEEKKKALVKVTNSNNPLVKQKSFEGLTRTIAMDCEMVGVGPDGKDSILARVSIVNQFGKCIYDKFVKPTEKVTDYRTEVSGVRKGDMQKGVDFKTVQKDVSDILQNRLLVGHAIHNDLKVLYLDHPHKMIRDTLLYKPFRKLTQGRNPSLKKLCAMVLGVNVQEGEHSSVQDAQAAMRLYTMHKSKWEAEVHKMFKPRHIHKRKRTKKKKRDDEFSISLDSD